jgi:RHS repeat-associated protein
MVSSWRSYLAVFVCFALAVAGVLVLTASHEQLASSSVFAYSGSPFPVASDLLAVPGVQRLDGSEQEFEQMWANRANPAAADARVASRTRYAGLDANAAVRTIRELAPTLVAKAPSGIGQLPSGAKVSRYVGTTTAQLNLPGGKHAVVESLTPMATRTSSSGYVPVDLSLRESSQSFSPVNSAVAVSIPKSLASGVKLDSTGVSLTPVDASGAPLQGVAQLDGGAVIYPGTGTDADTAAKPTAVGIETYDTLRSVDSPQSLAFKVGMPVGASLVERGDGSGSVAVMAAGQALAEIPAATAVDAEGTQVPVSTKLSGHTLDITVNHRAGDYRYPIVVDPTMIDSHTQPYTSAKTNWRFESSVCCLNGKISDYIESEMWHFEVRHNYVVNEWGGILYPTQGESHIYELTLETSSGLNAGLENHLLIFNAGGWQANLALAATHSRGSNTICTVALTCESTGGTAGNVAAYWINAIANGTGSEEMFAQVYTGSVYVAQTNGPSGSFDTTKEKVASGAKNALYGSGGWISETGAAAEIDESDPGVGVSEVVYTATGGTKWTKKTGGCAGSQCPETTTQQINYKNVGISLPDGEPTIEAKIIDGVGSTYTTSAKVKVDGTAPNGISLTGLPEGNQINDSNRSVKLVVKATDGAGTTPSSGVASLKLAIDGEELGSPSGNCSPGPCTATGEWTIKAEDFAAGNHAIKITALDNAGNSSSSETTLTVRHAAAVNMEPGDVSPVTGNFELGETDVSLQAAGVTLSVARNYSSREPTAGAEGPLGGAWTLSVAGAQQLEKTASGNVLLTSADGDESIFVAKGETYQSPPGDSNIELKYKASTNEYVLNVAGASTTFAKTVSGAANVWMPFVTQGAGGVETTTYAFETVSGITRPTEELAPVPAGVSCSGTLKNGCRALTFNYATSTTASGESPSGWGDYTGHLTRVYFTAYEPTAKTMATTTVAQYAYDTQGRLRAEWDPRIFPAQKTTYGYDTEGHVTAMSPPGEEPWLIGYGTTSSDTSAGRAVTTSRPVPSTALGSGIAPANTAVPGLSTLHPMVGKALSASAGTWSNSPLSYRYQWERCNSSGGSCGPMGGAINREYTPKEGDLGSTLVVRVSATNAGGTASAVSTASAVVTTLGLAVPQQVSEFGSSGSGNGQFKSPWGVARDHEGNVWVADTSNNRVEEFDAEGKYLRVAGTSGSGLLSGPEDVAVDSSANVWVADRNNSRVVEFNSTGEYLRAFGSLGTGNGQFKSDWGITVDEAGHVWVVDAGNNRVQEFTNEGTFIKAFGTSGTGNGQFKSPGEISVDSKGNLWVADTGNSRVQEFNSAGEYVRQFGASGSGNGQFCSPWRLAVDPNNDQVWVSDTCNNRVQIFTATGEFVQAFGTNGTGSGQLKSPRGLTFSPSGYVYVLDAGNSRVTKWSDGAPSQTSEFGTAGSGNGQFNLPWGLARDSSGNIWVADAGNNRIQEFDSTSKFLRTAGTSGSGLLSKPEALAVDASNNVWVTDTGKDRMVEFNPSGEYVRAFGATGSGTGQFKTPWGVAVDKAEHIWVSDSSNDRIQEFSLEGTWIRSVGTVGHEEGQLAWPGGVATDSNNNLWVADPGNNRISEFSSEGAFIRQVGSLGSGNGQFKNGPWGIAIDPAGHVWASDTEQNRVEVFSSVGTFIGKFGSFGTGSGQFKGPGAIAFSPAGDVYISDWEKSRVGKWSGASWWEGTSGGSETGVPSTATSTMEYGVPVSGAGAPYAMGGSDVLKWAQTDVPTEAAAVFPPTEPQGWPASDYKQAVVYYLDSSDRVVNRAQAGGGISTDEYNTYNDVVRALTPDNREASLKEGAKSSEVSQTLDTQSTYGSEGSELLSKLEPKHSVKLASGTQVEARRHTVYTYDENAPSGGPYRMVTKVTEGAQITGEPEADIRTTTMSYSGENNLGWILREPTSTTIDPAGLKLTHTTIYDATSGDVTETRTPGAGAPGEELLSGYVYRSTFGSLGSGNGQISKPAGIARDKEGNVWVADTENNRVEEFSSGGTFVRQFGTVGTGNGQLKKPAGITIDGEGNVWVADTGNNRVEKFSGTGTYLFQFGSEGAGYLEGAYFKSPTSIAYSAARERLVVADSANNVVREFSLTGEFLWKLGSSSGSFGSENGKFHTPEGVGVDSSGNIWVADTTNNRVQEFSSEGTYITKMGTEGSGNGNLLKPKGVAVDSEGNVFVADTNNNRMEEFTASGAYSLQFGSAGTGEQNMKTPGGLALDSMGDAFVIDTGNSRIQKWAPAGSVHESKNTGGTYGTQTIYYTPGANSQVTACGEHPEWTNLVCETRPATQPETSGVPNLPVTVYTYDMLDDPTSIVETVGTTTRTVTETFDSAGRALTHAITSSVGTALPTVKYEYSSETGDLTKQSATIEGSTKTLEDVYDKWGRLSTYTDADGNTSTYTYDAYGRPEKIGDSKGTQTFGYDSSTGRITQITDSAAGTFTNSYDVEGKVTSSAYPNGMNVLHSYNPAGEETAIEYLKTTHCSSGCTWYRDSVVPSIQGQSMSQTDTFASQAYTYDSAGRLTKTQDTPAGSGCTTRIYADDVETNRTSLTTRAPGTGGVCTTEGGSAENHTYDTANRLTDAGIAYDTFGDITKLSAADAGGSELTSAYYTSSALASQTQKGETIGYGLDPDGRPRVTVSTGEVNSTVTSHYDGESRTPAWTEDTGGKWTRNIGDIGGKLVATQANGEAAILQVENLQGSVVATASLSETATGLLSTNEPTEYGVPRGSSQPRYSWLGTSKVATEFPSGIIAMGARSYVPQLGRFLQTDAVAGGSANAYTYTFGDPVNTSDPSGAFTVATPEWVSEALTLSAEKATQAAEEAAELAAEEAAAQAEAEREAAEAAAAASEEGASAPSGGGRGRRHKGGRAGGGASISIACPHAYEQCSTKPKPHKRHDGGKADSKAKKDCQPTQFHVGNHCENGPKKPPKSYTPQPEEIEVPMLPIAPAIEWCLDEGLCEI